MFKTKTIKFIEKMEQDSKTSQWIESHIKEIKYGIENEI